MTFRERAELLLADVDANVRRLDELADPNLSGAGSLNYAVHRAEAAAMVAALLEVAEQINALTVAFIHSRPEDVDAPATAFEWPAS